MPVRQSLTVASNIPALLLFFIQDEMDASLALGFRIAEKLGEVQRNPPAVPGWTQRWQPSRYSS